MPATLHSLVLTVLVAACTPSITSAQNLFKERRTKGTIVADVSAADVGDILTIVINETTRIRNEDSIERENSSSLAAELEAYSLSDDTFKTNVLPEFDIRQRRDFIGEARQEKDSDFEASIAVVVIDVMPNGNMVVAGSRVITVDDETKTLRISGLVRRHDVTSRNTVASSLVANAKVAIESEGGNARVTTKGPVGELFDTIVWAVWPF